MEQTSGVLPPAPEKDPAENRIGPRPGSGKRTIVLIVVASVVVLLVAMATILIGGLVFWRSSEPVAAPSAAQSYSGTLAAPLRLVPVTAESQTGCTGTGTPGRFDGSGCFTLGEGGMVVTAVERVNTALQDGQWTIKVRFSSDDTVAFRALTTQNTGKRIAMVLDGTVLTAPTIAEPITGGEVVISGNFTKNDVETVFSELTTR